MMVVMRVQNYSGAFISGLDDILIILSLFQCMPQVRGDGRTLCDGVSKSSSI